MAYLGLRCRCLEISVILAPQGARKKSVSGSRPGVMLTKKNQYLEADIERYIKLLNSEQFSRSKRN